MARQNEIAPIAVLDCAPGTFERISSLATVVFNEHTDNSGLCAVCGSAWPCELVVLADHNLAGF